MALPYYTEIAKKVGSKRAPVIYGLAALVVIFIVYRLYLAAEKKIREVFGTKDQRELQKFLDDAVTTSPTDGITPSDQQQVDFEEQAAVIADMQQQAMTGVTETDEQALFNQLIDLNGWQLVMVANAFGVRDYPGFFGGPTPLNLFGWYDQELSQNCTWGLQYTHPDVEGCTEEDTFSYWCSGCTERQFMRGIWKKSGLAN